MPHDPSGPCVVRGIETTQRCSSCAEHGFDLFLCGREHQKLIGFAHKRVCGVNSNPFRFPPLTFEETLEAIERKDHVDSSGGSIMVIILILPQLMAKQDSPTFLTFLESLLKESTSMFRSDEAAMLRTVVRGSLFFQDREPWGLDGVSIPQSAAVPPGAYDTHKITASVAFATAVCGKPGEDESAEPCDTLSTWLEFFAEGNSLQTHFLHLVVVTAVLQELLCRERYEHIPLKQPRSTLVAFYRIQRWRIDTLAYRVRMFDADKGRGMQSGLTKFPVILERVRQATRKPQRSRMKR